MADQSDVENALLALAANALYPNGTGSASVPGPDCLIYRGWPISAALDADLAAGRINVTIFPSGEPGRNTTRFLQLQTIAQPTSTFTATVDDDALTIGGYARANQLIGVWAGEASYVYSAGPTDTPETVAANLGNLISADRIVSLSGATLTMPGAARVIARVVGVGTVTQEMRRQEQSFRITCWCPTPESRDVSAATLDQLFVSYRFLSLADGTQGRIRYRGTLVFDQSQDALLYRRDLLYDVDYSTTAVMSGSAMLFGDLILNAASLIA